MHIHACLITLASLSLSASASVCSSGIYKDLLVLSAHPAAEIYCSLHYPLPKHTVTVTSTPHKYANRHAPTSGKKFSTTAIPKDCTAKWSSAYKTGGHFLSTLCSCIETPVTKTSDRNPAYRHTGENIDKTNVKSKEFLSFVEQTNAHAELEKSLSFVDQTSVHAKFEEFFSFINKVHTEFEEYIPFFDQTSVHAKFKEFLPFINPANAHSELEEFLSFFEHVSFFEYVPFVERRLFPHTIFFGVVQPDIGLFHSELHVVLNIVLYTILHAILYAILYAVVNTFIDAVLYAFIYAIVYSIFYSLYIQRYQLTLFIHCLLSHCPTTHRHCHTLATYSHSLTTHVPRIRRSMRFDLRGLLSHFLLS
ncbi:uncharacterized protein BDZ99DRAFT_529488 [Mytilinidion resinicola]|uniref:Uncharacterized protein n=1 Tax=Mytilinidion resinicola TaxID=574789 RepID=A0A6A6Z8R6_9PEZI|nr:uncharacterized protein BDZ99DRAFT_529488 [Mytilinidion resinicola]KAF2817198.1 hypothetical protein BDZ99DRAFT_529488 [Mytilinidion resinicola]